MFLPLHRTLLVLSAIATTALATTSTSTPSSSSSLAFLHHHNGRRTTSLPVLSSSSFRATDHVIDRRFPFHLSSPPTTTTLRGSSEDGAGESRKGNHQEDDDSEEGKELLLRIHFSFPIHNNNNDDAGEGTTSTTEAAMEALQTYTKSFPFAAVLPVQPLTYVPTADKQGVKVTFLRKKTPEKGSIDGGMDFMIREGEIEGSDDDDGGRGRIHLVATRNSEGQTISKAFSEKLVVRSFVEGLSEPRGERLLADANVAVDSVFHIWM